MSILGRVALGAQQLIVVKLSRERSVGRCVGLSSALWKTADQIRMPFQGVIGRTGPVMRRVVGFGIGQRERVLLGANLGRAIVTNGDFTACLLYTSDAADE